MVVEQPNLVLVIPVFNDWESASILIQEIAKVKIGDQKVQVILVNDASTQVPQLSATPGIEIEILHLQRNLGHQKAICIGLTYATQNRSFDYAVIMDSDGEDNPKDIKPLLEVASRFPNQIVFAHRAKRNENFSFRLLYKLYKIIFKILTGLPISFGNYCVVPFQAAKRLTFVSEIWNHFSGGVIKSGLPYQLHPTERSKRYFGKSKMNLQSLILHGLSSVSVHIDTVSVRMLLASISLLFLSTMLILFVAGIKLLTQLAIPGWTSNIILGLSLVFLQALFLSILLVFIILSYRTQKTFIPATDYQVFINSIDRIS